MPEGDLHDASGRCYIVGQPGKRRKRLSAAEREALSRLVDVLYDFLPLTSYSESAVTFRSIFAESRIAKYLDPSSKKATKKQRLLKGWTLVYRNHPRLPYTLIRRVVPAAIDYRRSQRKPLTREELNRLADCLADLGIDMRAELAKVELDESLERITVPPDTLKQRLRKHDLHPAIATEPLQLFENGHFNEAVRKAAERFEAKVQEMFSSSDLHGRNLMGQAFNSDTLLAIEQLRPVNRKDFVDGYRFLAMGMMAAARNVFSHGDEERRSPEECFEMLMFVNWMFRGLRDSESQSEAS